MRIVFIGIVEFSYHCLVEVLKNNGNVVGIVTSGNVKNNSDFCDLTSIGTTNNIPVCYCSNVNAPEVLQWIEDKNPDIIFCWGWSQLIKLELLKLPPMGVLGVHPALLPENRGRHPIIWALVLGLKSSGLTFFFMDEYADSGPILSQRQFEISPQDNASSLYEKIKELAAWQIAEFLPQLIAGNYKTTVQNPDKANYWRKRSSEDGLIDWRMSEVAILNLVRALVSPYPGAQFVYKGQKITVLHGQSCCDSFADNIEPGKILLVVDGKPTVKCYDGAILISSYEPVVDFIVGDYIK